MDTTTELATLRRLVAEHIFSSYKEPAGLTGDQAVAVAAVGHAATELHETVTAAGIDLAPELDALGDQAAADAFERFEGRTKV
ncbi:hypothetical protein ACIRP5_37110 [Streptomyces sp. NPDC101221]|uniref:hypothetical protein n=1 Tax=Streptomyces sp. NPDC101221 TaxID=3366132 RepID=UPI0037F85BD2